MIISGIALYYDDTHIHDVTWDYMRSHDARNNQLQLCMLVEVTGSGSCTVQPLWMRAWFKHVCVFIVQCPEAKHAGDICVFSKNIPWTYVHKNVTTILQYIWWFIFLMGLRGINCSSARCLRLWMIQGWLGTLSPITAGTLYPPWSVRQSIWHIYHLIFRYLVILIITGSQCVMMTWLLLVVSQNS